MQESDVIKKIVK